MVLPVVVIEIAAESPRPPFADELAAACTAGLGEGHCVLGDGDSPAARDARAVVFVGWETGESTARVEIDFRDAAAGSLVVRDLVFQPNDIRVERWRAVGLAVGAVVSAIEAIDPPQPEATKRNDETTREPSSQSTRDATSDAAAEELKSARWIGIEFKAAPAMDDGTLRFGGALRFSQRIQAAPVLVGCSAEYLWRPSDTRGVSVGWSTITLGLGGTFSLGAGLSLEPRLVGIADWLRAEVEDDDGTDGGSAFSLGARLGLDLVFSDGLVAPMLGFEGQWLARPTRVELGDETIGRSGPVSYLASAGVRFRLP